MAVPNQAVTSTLNVYHPGYAMPLLESASGKVHLAFSNESEQESVYDLVRRHNEPTAERAVARLRVVLDDIRKKGYGIQDRIRHTANPGKTSAIPVPITTDGTCRAMVTQAFASSMTLSQAIKTFLPRIKLAARAITHDMSKHYLGA